MSEQTNRPILILGAMAGEIAEFLRALRHGTRDTWRGFEFHRGTIEGHNAVVAKSGVGKAMAACVTQRLVDTYAPRAIVFTGLAGGLNPDLDIGDCLIARDCIQHDLDATALGFARGEVPYSQYRILECGKELVAAASQVTPLSGKSMVGRVLTGDQFLVAANLRSREYLQTELEGDVVEMEGASVGLVAEINDVPFLIARFVSDRVDGSAKGDFSAFLREAARASRHFVTELLGLLKP
jgi:adenosylhomocysteine nucleosidase/adenosylhomocysteine/aminodeoxyfutalosine nucleosidase